MYTFNYTKQFWYTTLKDCLCDPDIRVLGYRSRGPRVRVTELPDFLTSSEWVWNGVHSVLVGIIVEIIE
jgi:hypothetical protein